MRLDAPLETTDVYYQRMAQFSDERKRIHAAMIVALDEGVGRILDRLEQIGVAGDTVVVFTSDNGGPEVTDADGRCNAPYIGHKRQLYEGGIRMPYLVRWPGHLEAGRTYDQMVSTLDLLPTLLAAAGAAPGGDAARPLDGVNLLPFLTGDAKKDFPHETLFAEAVLAPGAVLPLDADYDERGIYIASGEIDVAGEKFGEGRLLVFKPGDRISILAVAQSRLMLLGGEPMDGPRHIWWNFVSSSKERIEAAKNDWRAKRFALVPGDEKEFIPLPE